MKWLSATVITMMLVVGAPGRAAAPAGETTAAEAIDWTRAQQLLGRQRRGERLTPEEQAYLDRARALRRAAQSRPAGPATQPSGTGLVPLDQMTADDRYRGEDGGLYGGGQNRPPADHQRAIANALAEIRPLSPDGRPDTDGRIVLLAIGMSNTTQEFSRFKQLADQDPAKSPWVVIVDGAQGGKDGTAWAGAAAAAQWQVVDRRLTQAGATSRQVQALWVKHAQIQPARLGAFPAHAEVLKKNIIASLAIARERCPNLRVAYLSSRIYAGYASTPLNPEPYAYESAFAVRWVIRAQMEGDPALNWDPARGEVKAPVVLWGPYLWADGAAGRKSDTLVWRREDLGPDGTHPSMSGRDKVARLLLAFFTSDPNAKGWFARPFLH